MRLFPSRLQRDATQNGLAHSVLGGLLGLQCPIEEEELEAECPSQNRASLGLGGLGKDLELSSNEAWFRGGGGSTTEQESVPRRPSSEQCCEGQGPLYQQSSFRLSGSVPDGGPTGGRPEHEGNGGVSGGCDTDALET